MMSLMPATGCTPNDRFSHVWMAALPRTSDVSAALVAALNLPDSCAMSALSTTESGDSLRVRDSAVRQ
jgi:hypothetical protein